MWVGRWEEPQRGRSPVGEEQREEGEGLVGKGVVLRERTTLERRVGIFCDPVGAAGCWRKRRSYLRNKEGSWKKGRRLGEGEGLF